jgi:hypothetical protein
MDQVHGEGEPAKTLPSGRVIDRQGSAAQNHTVMLPVSMSACQVSLQVSTIPAEVKVCEVKVCEVKVCEVKVSNLFRHSPHFRFSLTWRSKNALTTCLLLPTWLRSCS